MTEDLHCETCEILVTVCDECEAIFKKGDKIICVETEENHYCNMNCLAENKDIDFDAKVIEG